MGRKINNMCREELIRLINSVNGGQGAIINPINKVSVCYVEVASNMWRLNNCMRAVNELLKTNSKVIKLRHNKIKTDIWGYFG